jgi:eukaryotic-like serine/threonine-protein kinase
MNSSSQTQPFDAEYWKRVNDAFDQAFDLEGDARSKFMATLAAQSAPVAAEVKRLIDRAERQGPSTLITPPPAYQALATALIKPNHTTPLTPISGDSANAERGFDGLLQRALRADRATQKSARYRGEMCGAWRLKEVIGRGGMGEVWLAERADGLFHAQAAVKFLRPDGDMSKFEARFSQERALLARLNHPGIARLLDAGRQFGHPFLVLEYVDGLPLLEFVAQYAPTVESRLSIIRGIAEAITYAHSQLVVHRDLKPSNVLITPGGTVKLLDFGVAGLLAGAEHDQTTESAVTRISGRGLTLEYAAPEQITGDPSGVASDVYSLGSLAFHILSGRRAFVPEKGGRAALEYAILHTEPMRVSEAAKAKPPTNVKDNVNKPVDLVHLNGDVDAIIAHAMRRNPAERYRTASDFVADLRRFAEKRPISARREDRSYQAKLWLRRNWLPTTLGTTLFVALAAGLGVSLWQADRARHEAQRAVQASDYLAELLSGADPDLHGGNWPSALTLIERARGDLATKFANEPNVEQKLSYTVARTLRRLSRFQEALPIAERAYTLSKTLHGESAEPTRIAAVLLADTMYWLDKTEEALPMLTKALGVAPPAPMPEWWRDGYLLHANMVSELRRFPEAYAQYDTYRELIKGHPEEAWLETEMETDRALVLMSEGRHQESLRIHRTYRNRLLNPPQHAKRIALTNLANGAMMMLYMGEPDGVEQTISDNVRQWDQLAGPYNRHSLEALGRLGFYNFAYDRPNEAIKAYSERIARLKTMKPTSDKDIVSVSIDLLEVQAKWLSAPAAAILSEASVLEREVKALVDIETPIRLRLLQRLAMVRLTFGETSALAESVIALPAPMEPINQRADRAVNRWVGVGSLLAATGKLSEACDAFGFAADQWGAQNRVLIAAPLYLRTALICAFSNSPHKERHLAKARQSLPPTLPAGHRLRHILDHVERVARAKTVQDVEQSQRQLAAQLNMPALVKQHSALLGLLF